LSYERWLKQDTHTGIGSYLVTPVQGL